MHELVHINYYVCFDFRKHSKKISRCNWKKKIRGVNEPDIYVFFFVFFFLLQQELFIFNKHPSLNCSIPSSSTGPYAYAGYNRALFLVPMASTNVSYQPDEITRPTHATV